MGYALIVFSSSTTASRLKRLAALKGIRGVNIIQTPKSISKNGCTYALRCPGSELFALKALAEEYGLGILTLYREILGTDGRKTYELY